MNLPRKLEARLAGYSLAQVGLGESGAAVWRCTTEGSPSLYLKTASLAASLHLDHEAARLRWMKQRELRVPVVSAYTRSGAAEYLLLEELPGVPASDAVWTSRVPELVTALGTGLAHLHRASTAGCPFDQRIARQVEEARLRLASGAVREDDFDEIRAGRRATDLFTELISSVPHGEDLVLGHGDFCLPNVILRDAPRGHVEVAGFVDCGRAGVADRHQDLALAVRSILRNIGPGWVQPFLDAYGMPIPRPEMLSFFTLLDEFF